MSVPFVELMSNGWESGAVTYRRLPVRLVSGEGVWLHDADGRRYLDFFAGAGATALGHGHPAVVRALHDVLDCGAPLTTVDFATPLRDAFCEELFQVLPTRFAADAKVHFCGPSGANAVEAAVTLLSYSTGRREFLAFRGAYHGSSLAARSLSGDASMHECPATGAFPVTFLPYPDAYRCPFGVGGDDGARLGLKYIHSLLTDRRSGSAGWAGLVAEFVLGEGGVVAPPPWWITELAGILVEACVPLVADEVQAGLGRTGKMWAFEHGHAEPDVIIISKAVGGGVPMALIAYRPVHDRWPEGAFTGTFRGSALAFSAGAATLKVIREEKLADNAAARGAQLLAELRDATRDIACVGDVRGRGLMIGVEIVRGRDHGDLAQPDASCARRVRNACLDERLLVELGGVAGNVVRFLPPLVVTSDEASSAVDRFASALRRVERGDGA